MIDSPPPMTSRRRRLAVSITGGLGLVVAALAAWAALGALLTGYPLHPRAVRHDPGVWRGAYHIHTTASKDGRGTVEDVVRAARGAGLSWALITDHNLVDLPEPEYRDGVLVVYAVESSTTHGHLVLLNSRRGLERKERRGETPLAIAQSLGGALVAAHPVSRRRPFLRLDDGSIGGMEVLSLNDALREAADRPLMVLWAAWTYPFNPVRATYHIVHEPRATLDRWDALLHKRPVSAYGALDAHGWPSYDGPMRTLSMHALVGRGPTGDAESDAEALVAALVAGRSFLCVEAFSPGAGFRFVATVSLARWESRFRSGRACA
jgi:hypothetical protein